MQSLFQLFSIKRQDKRFEDEMSSYERKSIIVQDYYKSLEEKKVNDYLTRLMYNDYMVKRHLPNLPPTWNIVTADSVTESDSLILYFCSNWNHASSEIHKLRQGENINTPFWMENAHDYGDGGVTPMVYRIIPSFENAETTTLEKWNRVHVKSEIGQQVPEEITKGFVLAILFDDEEIHYYTIDSCMYVYRLMNSMDDMIYWNAEGFTVIGYLTLEDHLTMKDECE